MSVPSLVAGGAIGAAVAQEVAPPPQRPLALEAAEMPEVPVPTLRLCAPRREDDLGGGGRDTYGGVVYRGRTLWEHFSTP